MFLSNPKGPKDTMQSLFQSYGEQNHAEKTKLDQIVDNNVATLSEIERNADNKSIRSFIVDGEGPLSEEMEKVKEAEMCELKLREQICHDSPELEELNNKLQKQLLRKDIALQMQEKENRKEEDKILDQFYRDQLYSATQRQMLEAETQEKLASQRKAEYRRALEEQMAAEAERKKEEKYRRFLEEQQLTHAEIERMVEEDKKSRAAKLNKTHQIREDMQEALKTREQGRQEEKMKNQELEKNVLSYWEESTKHETELKQERQERQRMITQRQEQCAQSLQEINQRKQTRSDLMDNITLMSQLVSHDSAEMQNDLDLVDKKLKQSQLCSELDGQVADNVRNRQTARREKDEFQETWIWGDNATQQKGKQEAKLRKDREVSDYNQATVRQHEADKKRERHCNEVEEMEDVVGRACEQELIEEEKQRLLDAQTFDDQ